MKRVHDRHTLAARYLRPMGIDSWVFKTRAIPSGHTQAEPAAATPAATRCVTQATEATSVATTAVYQLDEQALDRWLGESQFQTLEAGDGGPLLIAMEGGTGGADADALLASMLKAIALDIGAQCRAGSGDYTAPLHRPAQVRAILLMARLAQPSDIASLAHLRQRLLQHAGIALAVTIHPIDLLANNAAKRPAWEDLKRLKKFLDEQRR